MSDHEYSTTAEKQLDSPGTGPDADLYDAVLDRIDLIFDRPRQAQRHSTDDGIVPRLPVAGFPPYKIFWTSEGPASRLSSLIRDL